MPFGDESESEEAEVRDDEDPEITAAGRKVVHGTATNANSKAYAYLPPDELGLDPEEIQKLLEPAQMTQLRQQDPNYFKDNPLPISGDHSNCVTPRTHARHTGPQVAQATLYGGCS
jgi:hypothetical protein